MSCTDEVPGVEREVVLPAPPADVWDLLPSLLGDDVELAREPGGGMRAHGPEGERVGVVEEVDAPHRLTFWWVSPADDGAPSRVEIELTEAQVADSAVDGTVVGTILRVRETRFDAAFAVEGLLRGPLARARA